MSKQTHFGYKQVDENEKASLVRGVFDSVSSRYDIMNDVMSMGIHRIWKRIAIERSGVKQGHHVLDIAGGTGDLTKLFLKRVGDTGSVILSDINASMLSEGRNRLLDQGYSKRLRFVQANAECLPFADNSFDCVSIAFGLRNVTDKDAALRSMYRILKPGGRLLILEFSKPKSDSFKKIYDLYSMKLIPKFGKLLTGDAESYQYLVESIRMHPDQETLATMMRDAGFDEAKFENMTNGIVALHLGYKY